MQKKTVENIFHFKYLGIHKNIQEDLDISKELSYFKNFLQNERLQPFRTEWRIYDKNLKIAGTIDFISRTGENYDIYDWKRSKKIDPTGTIWRYGLNGLGKVPDTNYYHYCLQQNLYKYILENNYGITINNKYLVVLHPNNLDYVKYEVPKMCKEMEVILTSIKKAF